MKLKVMLPDGDIREYDRGTTIEQVAKSIGASLMKHAVAGKINGAPVDLNWMMKEDCQVEIITLDSKDGLEILRHSTAHVMAQAIKRIYGNQAVNLGIGPVIDDGFYYDIDLGKALTTDDLSSIEKEMERIVQEDLPIVRRVISREEAVQIFSEDPLKLELIHDLPKDAVISIYDQGEFFDLCRGPHLPSTGRIKAFKLMSVAGAYWRGDSNNPMLQRIYGTAFPKRLSWMNICKCSKKPGSAITGSWAKSSDCLCFPKKRPACLFICLRE